jgi:DNA-binding transcriptional MerR regulator
MQYTLPLDTPAPGTTPPVPVFDARKTYYSIGEVCSHTELEPHVLRYWESEFPQLRPKKNRAGNRAYREKDIEVIRFIKQLLYEEKYTIPGAKKKLSGMKDHEIKAHAAAIAPPPAPTPAAPALQPAAPAHPGRDIKQIVGEELRELLRVLKS